MVLQATSGGMQRSELGRRVCKAIEDVREALRLGDPGAVDAFNQLEVGAKSLVHEFQARVEYADAHRGQNDDPEDHGEGRPAP